MSLIIITGYAVAVAPPGLQADREAGVDAAQRQGGPLSSWRCSRCWSSLISWSFTLIFSALLAREVARRMPKVDYRALGAAAFLGIGSIWALGLSSSAALIMAASASLPDSVEKISGVIPLSQTIGLWQSGLMAVVIVVMSMTIAYYSCPSPEHARSAAELGVDLEARPVVKVGRIRPGEWLENSPLLTLIVSALGGAYLVREVGVNGWGDPAGPQSLRLHVPDGGPPAALDAALVHPGRDRRYPGVAGVMLQYPIYAGHRPDDDGVGAGDADGALLRRDFQRTHLSRARGIYSAVLGVFIPSAGAKWLVEAPYLLEAAKSLNVHLGWIVQTYNATEALANMIHPFWMLPLIGILGLKPRDIVGYSMLQFVVHVPVVLFLVWILNYTL
jgi:short-chain fatty acids transporter